MLPRRYAAPILSKLNVATIALYKWREVCRKWQLDGCFVHLQFFCTDCYYSLKLCLFMPVITLAGYLGYYFYISVRVHWNQSFLAWKVLSFPYLHIPLETKYIWNELSLNPGPLAPSATALTTSPWLLVVGQFWKSMFWIKTAAKVALKSGFVWIVLVSVVTAT